MAIPKARKEEALAGIREHLATYGPVRWKLLYARFPDISERTLRAWADKIRREHTGNLHFTEAEQKIIERTKGAIIDRHEEARATGTEPIARHLPAAPSPAYIAKNGEKGLRNIDFVAEIQKLYRDAEMLRAYAVTVRKDAEGNETEAIRNPVAFDKSIARRANLLETAIRAVQEIWDLRTMQQFYEIVIDEIGRESPECQRRILERLAALNQQTGMTLSAMRV